MAVISNLAAITFLSTEQSALEGVSPFQDLLGTQSAVLA